MSNESQHKAMIESAVSVLITIHAAKYGSGIDKSDADVRSEMRELIEKCMAEYRPDPTSWSKMSRTMLYDVYLEMRKNEGTVTEFDLVRPGLTLAMFADPDEYSEHIQRCSASSLLSESDKQCSKCNNVKPAHKFKKRGGSVCNACRSKIYRDRKKVEVTK